MQLRPRINAWKKIRFYDLSGVPHSGSSGTFSIEYNILEKKIEIFKL
jgi:hypothetical protein